MTELVHYTLRELNSIFMTHIQILIHPLLMAYADYSLMSRVLTNLLSNAIKYSGTKENPCIEISSFHNNNNIVYCIKDNGVGFDMKYYDKLFGVFQRLHNPREFEGTGVGLALMKRIILKHGGTIWAEAEVGKGAAFYFTVNKINHFEELK